MKISRQQLAGTFDVLRSGVIAAKGGAHMSARQQFQRGKIVAAIDHKCAAGMTGEERSQTMCAMPPSRR